MDILLWASFRREPFLIKTRGTLRYNRVLKIQHTNAFVLFYHRESACLDVGTALAELPGAHGFDLLHIILSVLCVIFVVCFSRRENILKE